MQNGETIAGGAGAFSGLEQGRALDRDLAAVLARLLPIPAGVVLSLSDGRLCASPRAATGLAVTLTCGAAGYTLTFNGVALDADRFEAAVDLYQAALRGRLRVIATIVGGRIVSERLEMRDAGGAWSAIAGYDRMRWHAWRGRRDHHSILSINLDPIAAQRHA